VLIGDVEGFLEPEAIERLIESGLVEDDPGPEIFFSGMIFSSGPVKGC